MIQHDHFVPGMNPVMVWEGLSLMGRADLHILAKGTPTAVRYRNKILRAIARPYAGAVGPWFLLVHDQAYTFWPHEAGQFLDGNGIDGPQFPQTWVNLRTSGILCLSIRSCQVALQIVQDLSSLML